MCLRGVLGRVFLLSFFLASNILLPTSYGKGHKISKQNKHRLNLNQTDEQISNEITILAGEFPPYNYMNNGQLGGISVDLLREILELNNYKKDHEILALPWKRAFMRSLVRNNTVLFSTIRHKSYENKFKWVGPIGTILFDFWSLKDSDLEMSDPHSFKNLKIGIINNDNIKGYISDLNIDNNSIVKVSSYMDLITMLATKQVDIIAVNYLTLSYTLNKMKNQSFDDLKKIYSSTPFKLYYAFNKQTSDSIIQKFQKSLNYVKSKVDGQSKYDEIVNKYISSEDELDDKKKQ